MANCKFRGANGDDFKPGTTICGRPIPIALISLAMKFRYNIGL